ncbi:hypothetical protein AGRA3207_004194 [Actinomadura graeca]|uniref:Secreted protein n=1 Tax=Actinomadura graeca TaxID=2750812 RepID=A0ABX8QW60_9ACTN|nr:hypothetical protein [Actinomadura graeca]QXJ23080.1 hypothetical protein AGRA3207_004194 [Actinomadura graeca]
MSSRTFIAAGATALGLLMDAAVTATVTGAEPQGAGYVAEFDVSGETSEVRLVEREDIEDARALLDRRARGSNRGDGDFWDAVMVSLASIPH